MQKSTEGRYIYTDQEMILIEVVIQKMVLNL